LGLTPTHPLDRWDQLALDVSGSVAVSGSLNASSLTAGNVAFKVYYCTGTLGAVNTTTTVSLPSYFTSANIISITGLTDTSPSGGGTRIGFAWAWDGNWAVSVEGVTLSTPYLYLMNTGALTPGKPYYVTIMYY